MRLEVAHTDYATLHAKRQRMYVLSFNEANIVNADKIAEMDRVLREKFLHAKKSWEKPRTLILDMKNVAIMDVEAIGRLLKLFEKLQEKGDSWMAINVQSSVWAALDILKKVEVFNVERDLTEEAAIAKAMADQRMKAREARHAL